MITFWIAKACRPLPHQRLGDLPLMNIHQTLELHRSFLHTITDYFRCHGTWHHNRSRYQKWFSRRSALCCTPSGRRQLSPRGQAITTQGDVCVAVDVGSRSDQTGETPMNSASTCLSTGSAVLLSAECCFSSYKHLLWRVQGPFFTRHLFSQMILLPCSLTSGPDRRLPTLLRSFFLNASVHLTATYSHVECGNGPFEFELWQ